MNAHLNIHTLPRETDRQAPAPADPPRHTETPDVWDSPVCSLASKVSVVYGIL